MKRVHNIARLAAAMMLTGMVLPLTAQDGLPDNQPTPPQPPTVKKHPPNERKAFQEMGGTSQLMEKIKREDPEAFQKLLELHRTDRQEFLKELRKLLRKRQTGKLGRAKTQSPRETKCQELAESYRKAETEMEKERLQSELKQAVEQAFEARLDNAKERLEKLEKQLERFKKHIQTLEQNREKIVETRVEELTRPPELNWNRNW